MKSPTPLSLNYYSCNLTTQKRIFTFTSIPRRKCKCRISNLRHNAVHHLWCRHLLYRSGSLYGRPVADCRSRWKTVCLKLTNHDSPPTRNAGRDARNEGKSLSEEILIHSKEFQKTKDKLNEILIKHMKKIFATIEADTDRDNFMSADEALQAYGLIDNFSSFVMSFPRWVTCMGQLSFQYLVAENKKAGISHSQLFSLNRTDATNAPFTACKPSCLSFSHKN